MTTKKIIIYPCQLTKISCNCPFLIKTGTKRMCVYGAGCYKSEDIRVVYIN